MKLTMKNNIKVYTSRSVSGLDETQSALCILITGEFAGVGLCSKVYSTKEWLTMREIFFNISKQELKRQYNTFS